MNETYINAENSTIENFEEKIKNLEDLHSLNVYQKRNIVVLKAKNATIWDINNKEFIDCAAGIGVANLGHGNEYIIAALQRQVEKVITCPSIFYNDTRAFFLEKLISVVPKNLRKVFLCNSGTESLEGAIKIARFSTGKTDFICMNRAFHGRTLGSLSATFEQKYKKEFEPLVPGFIHVPLNNILEVEKAITEKTAGVIIELIQGEGGVHIADPVFVKSVKKLCEDKNILLIIDEVQTGIARTGTFFACQHFDVEPDILCLAKSLGGGIPMGAVICSEKIKFEQNKHGSTFGGNPLACATGLATLEYVIDHKIDRDAEEKGKYLVKKLEKLNIPIIREIRGMGLMIGIELKTRVKKYVDDLLNSGIIVLVSGTTVIRLLPPLTISYEEIDKVIYELSKVLTL